MSAAIKSNRTNRQLILPLVVIGLVTTLLVAYFCWLQGLLYTHYQPFFDSMSYYNQAHAVMVTRNEAGVGASLDLAFNKSNSTVFMPFLLCTLLSYVLEPTRNVGVWIQGGQLAVLLGSLFYYFHRIRKLSSFTSGILLVPFIMTTCLYEFEGGMSDFRMDLSLYLSLSISCVWYLVATGSNRKSHYFLLGCAVAVACLFRATAPVYLILCLFPLVMWEFVLGKKNKREFSIRCAITIVTATAGAIWFYLAKFDLLYYYYFVWNTDANAKLPIGEAMGHVEFAFKHIGSHVLYWMLAIYAIGLLGERGRLRSAGNSHPTWCALKQMVLNSCKGTDWRFVYLGAAPLVFLVSRGAGLNPFVSMPAILGIMLCLLNPVIIQSGFFQYRKSGLAAAVVSLVCLVLIGIEGWNNHRPGEFNSMIAHQRTLETMVADAKASGLEKINYDSAHVFYLNSTSLAATARFDLKKAAVEDNRVVMNGVQVNSNRILSSVVAVANWEGLEGAEEQKLGQLISQVDATMDYLIVPDEPTIKFLEENISFNVINQHQRHLRSHVVQSGHWQRISKPIINGEHETVEIFKNTKRRGTMSQVEVETRLR